MARRLTDEEVLDTTYNKLFGDLDGIRSGSMFSSDADATQGAADNAGKPGMEGVSITVKPLMAAAAEGPKPDDLNNDIEEEMEKEDALKGIGKMSPLMERLHGNR